ncbi:MAG: hypothetical protein Q9N62_05980 [Ghiorsea sp.]|nr:hypothetical protein [Ghiorsea sp.]
MDEKEYSLNESQSTKRLQEAASELQQSSKDNFFGIWADKDLDASAYIRKIRQGRGFEEILQEMANNVKDQNGNIAGLEVFVFNLEV